MGCVFGYRYEAMQQQLKFGRCVSRPANELKRLEQRITDLEKDAFALGYPPVINAKRKCIGIGQQIPSATAMIESMLDEEPMYRFLSAVAHGRPWAIVNLGFKRTNRDRRSTKTVADTSFQHVEK
jgi:hypothetical protein